MILTRFYGVSRTLVLTENMAKNVCIIGAGPSGLVAAKTFLHDVSAGSYNVTIFEAQSRIGGLWPTSKDDADGLVHPLMVTNQSKHTVQFSDLAWRDKDPQFPRAWQVGQYLERYLDKYGGAHIRLGHKVVKADLQSDGLWKVETESAGISKTDVFDYLLVTTGFFGEPIWPEYVPKDADVPIIHSSKYRDLKSLIAKTNNPGGKILVIGGQMSGVEISATIATHLSSAIHSPGEKVIEELDKYSIRHIVQRPSWIFPLYTSPNPTSSAPPFLPCDLPSYNLANRPHPLKNTQGHISVETARVLNSIYQTALGTNQSEFSPDTKIDGNLVEEQPFLAMSQYYIDFVRSGFIKVSKGKVSSLSGDTVTISANEQISDIAAIVLATGFDPSPSLSFLPPSVLETISHSPSHPNLPVALAFHGTHHPSLPTLGFVGMYRSPYWGVMEMQARFMAHLWTAPNSTPLQNALAADNSIARTLSLRTDPRTSQFPMGDYAFLMQDFAEALSIPIIPSGPTPPLSNGKSMDILTPARYPYPPDQKQSRQEEVTASLRATQETAVAGLSHARFVAGAVFRSLLGSWCLSRTLSSRLPSHPSGRFVGIARFHLREGTSDGLSNARISSAEAGLGLGLEYLYEEDGTFTARDNPGLSFRATRRYVWRYDELADKMSVWFARTDEQMRADYLFHEVEFEVPSDNDGDGGNEGKGWFAKASHLCIEDLYDVHYEFKFNAVNLKEWKLGYTVKGPKKDYMIDGVYTR
ncbi:FAD/NAD(P)-binding domain-containing protein [Annulohypoxylon maeteangense]|uniref:FAD/NAD(P)-binding domain-containing protein n=1 Tax=Annulohypoxylon maeteangense TaxID=1927788 RepID=UPI0020074B8A|nr:FAD/NAD(P)-binding domain-containing protein [Annulohypoxylon maeteangense]KAI0880330.1 FAD/NAD(P)-binding domain-containing protein [Annulohypoxylon maeteangense]